MHSRPQTTILIALLMLVGGRVAAQAPLGDGVNRILTTAVVQEGDTIPIVHLKPVSIVTKWTLLTDKEIRKNQKLIRNVKKTLPYAKEARRRLQELLFAVIGE